MMEPRRPPIYLLTGLLIGLVLGVVYAWVLTPAETLETEPTVLRSDFKDTYRELIARAYLSSFDLNRAKARLALLDDEDPVRALAVQAQLSLGEGGVHGPARALGLLAAALQAEIDGTTPITEAAAAVPFETGESPQQDKQATATPANEDSANPESGGSPTSNVPPTATITPPATPTASPTPGPPFVLLDIQFECNPAIDPPQIQIFVLDASGKPVPGVAALVSWDGSTNRFITGLKPTFGLGYADFDMDPAVTYSLRLEDGGDPINSITGRLCEDAEEPFYGSWRFNFVQP